MCDNIGDIFPLTSPKPKYWRGCVLGIPGGLDASADFVERTYIVIQHWFNGGLTERKLHIIQAYKTPAA